MESEPENPDHLLQASFQPYRSDKNYSSDSLLSSESCCQNGGQSCKKLPPFYNLVSDWTIQMVEKYFHIFYTDEGTEYSGEFVLQKGGINTELSPFHTKYLADLKSILTFNGSMYTYKYRAKTKAKPMFRTILNNISPQNTADWKDRPIYQYLHSIAVFVKYMIKYVDRLQETEWFDHNVPEEYYTELVGRFAEMCLLLTNHLPDKSVWKNLKGITVTSKPDLRLFKCDTQDKVKETSFSVTQVKEDKYRDNKGENLAAKRMKISCSSDLDFDSKISKTTKRRPSKETANKVKGQHAGQLLLDLHSVHRKSFVNGSEYYMPGIIVHRTGVAVTMLVISKTHFEKIEKNEPLGLDDRAKIYVSCFYDYLNEEERNELIQVFLIMNNIQEYHTEHDEN